MTTFYVPHKGISFELRGRNRMPTGQLDPLFYTFADLVNRGSTAADHMIGSGVIPNFHLLALPKFNDSALFHFIMQDLTMAVVTQVTCRTLYGAETHSCLGML